MVEAIKLGIDGLDRIELIGRGGSSRVYRAHQVDMDRDVALKVLNATDDPEVLKRFDRERRAMGRLSLSDGIVPIYSSGRTERGEPYLVMPFYPDGSLQDRLAEGPLPWNEAVGYLTAAANTMTAAHENNVVHLDLKPANILLSSDGIPRIADFGIAKLLGDQTASKTTGASFTPAYTSPEILMGGDITPAADVYGLAATLWALISGRPPFRAIDGDNSVMAVINRVVHTPPDDLRQRCPEAVCEVIERGMAKDPTVRYASAGAFATALASALPGATKSPSVPPPETSTSSPTVNGSGGTTPPVKPIPGTIQPPPSGYNGSPRPAPIFADQTQLLGHGQPQPTPVALNGPPGADTTFAMQPQTFDSGVSNYVEQTPAVHYGVPLEDDFEGGLSRFGPIIALLGSAAILMGAVFWAVNNTPTSSSVSTLPPVVVGTSLPTIPKTGGATAGRDTTATTEPEEQAAEIDPSGPATSTGITSTTADSRPRTTPPTTPTTTPTTDDTTPTTDDATTTTEPSTTTTVDTTTTTVDTTTTTTTPTTTTDPTTTTTDPTTEIS